MPGQRRQLASPADEGALGRQLARNHPTGRPRRHCHGRARHRSRRTVRIPGRRH
jgi:hypothetical protein